jgi:uncharacterized protein DUF6152
MHSDPAVLALPEYVGVHLKNKLASLPLAVAILLVCGPLYAHHGTMFGYDQRKELVLKGTVIEFIWANPHVAVLFDVTDDSGTITHWGGEDGAPRALSLQGWSKDVMKPGDKITVYGHPAKNGALRVMDEQIVLADGRILKSLGYGSLGKASTAPPSANNAPAGPNYE